MAKKSCNTLKKEHSFWMIERLAENNMFAYLLIDVLKDVFKKPQ